MIQEDMGNGKIESVGVRGTAFIPDVDGVSVAWMQHPHHAGNFANKIQLMIACMRVRKIKKSHRLAVYPVGKIIECGVKFGKQIIVNHDPQPGYDCHSLVVGIDPEAADLLELIAAEILALEVMVV